MTAVEIPFVPVMGRGRKADRSTPAPDAPLLTIYQAAELLGLKPGGVKRHILAGRLQRVNPGGPRVTAYYRREDVEALRPYLRDAILQKKKEEGAAILAAGERECRKCHAVKALDAFLPTTSGAGYGGREATCYDCRKVHSKAYRDAHKALVRARWRRWIGSMDRETKRAFYRRRYSLHCKNGTGRRCVRGVNRIRIGMGHFDRRPLIRAIEEGKTSPICRRTGFALVVSAQGRWRAARLDKPLEPGETGMAHYEMIGGTWKVFMPTIASTRAEKITAWCLGEEEKQKVMS